MRILVFRGGAIGDFILTLPAFQALRQAWPNAELAVVGYPHIAELARRSGLIQHVLFIDAARFSAYMAPERPLPPAESEFLRSFDLVISYLHDPDGALRLNWERAGARRVISISPQPVSGHAADHFLRALEPLGLKGPDPCPAREFSGRPRRSVALHLIDPALVGTMEGRASSRPSSGRDIPFSFWAAPPVLLDLPPDLQSAGRARLESLGLSADVIAIHPGSGSSKKNWPIPLFTALSGKIRNSGLGNPLWIAGEADEAVIRFLEKERVSPGPVLKNCSLLDVASVLSLCRGYVGNDSGITHLAAALGIPTVALFGPTDPALWGPRGRHVAILQAQPPTSEGLARITVDDVYRKLIVHDLGKKMIRRIM